MVDADKAHLKERLKIESCAEPQEGKGYSQKTLVTQVEVSLIQEAIKSKKIDPGSNNVAR